MKHYSVKTNDLTPQNAEFVVQLAKTRGREVHFPWESKQEIKGLAINSSSRDVLYAFGPRINELSYKEISIEEFTTLILNEPIKNRRH